MSQKVIKMMLFSLAVVLLSLSVSATDSTFDKPVLIEKSDVPELYGVLSRSNAKGISLVKVSVDSKGSISNVELVRSTGIKILDEFFLNWVKEWKFLPKIDDNQIVEGFTILSIRYDLSARQFVAPPVNDLTMTLPEVYQELWETEKTDNEIDVQKTERITIQPEEPILVKKMPFEIQQKKVVVGTSLMLHLNNDGKVTIIQRPMSIRDDTVWAWVDQLLMDTEWPASQSEENRIIEMPLILDTIKCKAEFGEAVILNK